MLLKIYTATLFTLALIPSSMAQAKGDAAKGKTRYVVCSTCHGANGQGNKALNAPGLVGQESWYIVRQLENFKAGIRGTNPKDIYGMQMRPMAMTLPDKQAMEDVAAYIATLPNKK